MAINFFIADRDDIKAAGGLVYEFTSPGSDEGFPFLNNYPLTFEFTAPQAEGGVPAYVLQVLSYRYDGSANPPYVYTYRGEVPYANITRGDAVGDVSRTPHYKFSAQVNLSVGMDPYVVINLCIVDGNKRKVVASRNLLLYQGGNGGAA